MKFALVASALAFSTTALAGSPPSYGQQSPENTPQQDQGKSGGKTPQTYGQTPPTYGGSPPTYGGAKSPEDTPQKGQGKNGGTPYSPEQGGKTPPTYGQTPPTYGGTPPSYGQKGNEKSPENTPEQGTGQNGGKKPVTYGQAPPSYGQNGGTKSPEDTPDKGQGKNGGTPYSPEKGGDKKPVTYGQTPPTYGQTPPTYGQNGGTKSPEDTPEKGQGKNGGTPYSPEKGGKKPITYGQTPPTYGQTPPTYGQNGGTKSPEDTPEKGQGKNGGTPYSPEKGGKKPITYGQTPPTYGQKKQDQGKTGDKQDQPMTYNSGKTSSSPPDYYGKGAHGGGGWQPHGPQCCIESETPSYGGAQGGGATYGSQGQQCITPEEGQEWLEKFISILSHTTPDIDQTANELIADQYLEVSNSIFSLQGKKLSVDSVSAPNKEAYLQGITHTPPIQSIQTKDIIIGCDKLVWSWSFGHVGAGVYPQNGINIFHLIRNGAQLQADRLDLEFDSIAWGLNTGELESVTYANGKMQEAAMKFQAGPEQGAAAESSEGEGEEEEE